MSNSSELTDLFAKIASKIKTENAGNINDDQNDDVLVTSLNKSLNLSEVPRVRVLDTALSLMCFTAPQVFDSVIDCSVNAVVSVLTSSIECKVLRFGNAEVLLVGGSVSGEECVRVMECCGDVLGKLNEYQGTESRSLLYAAVRWAAMTTQYRYTIELTLALHVQSTDRRSDAVLKLMHCVPKRISLEIQELQLRLLLWYLDSQNLVKDISQVLQDAIGRSFICLREELYENMEWRSIIICLALSPLMFTETRALLHRWFLLTGLVSVLELQVELVSMVLDLLSRPMRWGLSAEIGSQLPFSYGYFLFKHRLFRTLGGPLSFGGFLELVQKIKKSVSLTKRKLKHFATTTSMVDHKSTWAMAMHFPNWFYFAALLLSGKSHSDSFFGHLNEDNQLQTSCSAAAAWYIAWILDPVDESTSELLAKKLEKLSTTLINKHSSSYEHRKTTGSYGIKPKKSKPNDRPEDTYDNYTGQTIRIWLERFETAVKENSVMFRKITLGILIGCFASINEDECELLLHYVATGKILQSKGNQHTGLKHRRWIFEGIDKLSRKEAVAGACIVFNLTDITEGMSDSIFETREVAVDFICQIKLKVVKYLLKCVKRLLEFEFDQNFIISIKDLHRRMLRWRHQGNDVFHGYKDFNDAVAVIASKLS